MNSQRAPGNSNEFQGKNTGKQEVKMNCPKEFKMNSQVAGIRKIAEGSPNPKQAELTKVFKKTSTEVFEIIFFISK